MSEHMDRMRAWEVRDGALGWSNPARPEPREGETLVKVTFSGVCGSDLAKITRTPIPGPARVWRPGHEIVGQDLGSPSSSLVVVDPLIPCGTCASCARGQVHLCPALRRLGWDLPGGFADFVVVPRDNVLPLAAEADPAQAVLADVLAVAIHGIRCGLPLSGSGSLAVIGSGPLALCSAAYASTRGWSVTVVVRDMAKLTMVKNRVNAAFLRLSEAPRAHFDAVADAASGHDDQPLRAALSLVRDGGFVVVQNAYDPGVRLRQDLRGIFRRSITITGSFSYCRQQGTGDLRQAVEILARRPAWAGPLVSFQVPLRELPAAVTAVTDSTGPRPIKTVLNLQEPQHQMPRMHQGKTAPGGPVLFSEDYYRNVVREYGYSTFDLQRFDFDLAGMNQGELNLRYLCHHAADQYAMAPAQRRIVTTGFGMSGPPHMATASHIMKMVRLQDGGEKCQIVLGDLDAYNGRGRSYGFVTALSDRFRIFAQRLGFDDTAGVLRNQRDHGDALANMYLLGRYTQEADFDAAEEDNHAYYAARGIVDAAMTFRRRLSLALMASDFITLGQAYEAVLVLLGVDEHRYVRFAQDVAHRFDDEAPLRGGFILAALYARLNTGFNGHPKFSKSIPGSSISVDTPSGEIARLVREDEARDPAVSPVFQLMHQMTYCTHEDLIRIHQDCAEGNRRWITEKEKFADYLVHVKELWP